MQESDIAAIARAREGHGDAYRELVERHSRALFRLAFRMTGRVEDAEDVVQETLLRAFRHLERYETRASFATWLHRIAANCALDVIRQRKRQREDEECPTSPELRPGPERLSYSADIQQCLERALGELSPQERIAFALRHFENQSIPEIAEALEVSCGAAKHSIFRAVQKLRQVLEPLVGREL